MTAKLIMRDLLKTVCIILFFCGASHFSSNQLHSQAKSDTVFQSLKSYYKTFTKTEISDPIILLKADTVYMLAERENNKSMMAVGLLYKMKHFRAVNNMDSILYYEQYIKDFCKKTGQKNHYYFAWRALIYHYMGLHYYNLALEELKDMPIEATKDNYIQGVIESYYMLAQLYMARGLDDRALENMEKAINMTIEYKYNDHNLSNKYLVLTTLYIRQKEYKKAEEALKIGLVNCKTNEMISSIYRGYTKLYLDLKDPVKAKESLDLAQHYRVASSLDEGSFSSLKAQYYILIKDYKKALEYYEELKQFRKYDSDDLKEIAFCYRMLGRNVEAYNIMNQVVDYIEADYQEIIRQQMAEQLASIELESTNAEKEKLESRLDVIDLRYTKILVYVLLFISVVFIILSLWLLRLNRKLKESESVRTAFLNNISHEIRTPLNSIVGFANIISEEASDNEDLSKYAGIIQNSSDALLRMISNASQVSDIDSLGQKMEIDVNEMCKQLIDNCKNNHANSEVLFVQNEYQEPSVFLLYYEKVELVLSNILDNAINNTEKGMITVDVDYLKESKSIQISITDTGKGIPDDKREKVFNYFVKLDEYSKGLGLGLPISRMVANSLKGSLILDSNYTTGCRFIFTFPVLS